MNNARNKAIQVKKLKVEDKSTDFKLHKMTHSTKNRVLFTGKGGVSKRFHSIEKAQKNMDRHDQP